jgi:hypothetical protein
MDDVLRDLEEHCHLGAPALFVNKALRLVLVGLAVPAAPAGCLLGIVHGAFMIVTFGLYAVLWTLVWLPMLGIILATSWVWWKVPILWPVWLLLALLFLLVGYVIVLLGPQDPGGEDKIAKAALLESWPYTYFVMFEKVPAGTSEWAE